MKDYAKIRETWQSLNTCTDLLATTKRLVNHSASKFIQNTSQNKMNRDK